ncbi:MAG: alanine racemase [Saonia sp.]
MSIKITEPTLLLDKGKCMANIDSMMGKVKGTGVGFRPHFKTHQSHEIGKWFRNRGVKAITVSSLTMAEYFASDGWDDITIAFPANILEIDTINKLASQIRINLVIESLDVVEFLAHQLTHPIAIFIKTDIGYHRTGVDPANIILINSLLDGIAASESMCFKGFLGHAGHSYKAKGGEDIATVHDNSLAVIKELKEQYINDHPDMIISVGDTPTCSVMDNFGVANEIRPGNFVFYDLTQWQIGSCGMEQIAVALACPVVAKHYDRNEVVLYGGGVHFSKDRSINTHNREYYGYPVPLKNDGWGSPDLDVYLSSLSQEHGIISANKAYLDSLQIGDVVAVLPIHSCMTSNLTRSYLSLKGEIINRL